jgi:glutaminyl-tRNA synthetase
MPEPDADAGGADFKAFLNPHSLETLTCCKVEPSLREASPTLRYQFERLGYLCLDAADSQGGRLVFNRTVSLRDSWAKQAQKEG